MISGNSTMASSKKSLSDKFALEAKKKSPGKQSKKEKKAAKSLSRELQKPASPKKKAQKSHSDSSVGPKSSKTEGNESDAGGQALAGVCTESEDVSQKQITFDTRDVAQPPEESAGATDNVAKKKEKEFALKIETPEVVRSTYDIGKISCPSHTIERLEPSLKDTWHKPPPTPGETQESFIDTSTPKTVKSSTEIQIVPREHESVPSRGSLLSVNSSFSSAASCLSESMTSCPSVDSISSELDTIIGDEINISECSSTSTPIRFTLHEENPENGDIPKSQRPPMFSLIREAKLEDTDSLSSSGLSPTSTSLKTNECRNRIDDFSDDSEGSKLRESSEFSDDMQELEHHAHFVPLNKQLQIVTSLDRLIDRYVYFERRCKYS